MLKMRWQTSINCQSYHAWHLRSPSTIVFEYRPYSNRTRSANIKYKMILKFNKLLWSSFFSRTLNRTFGHPAGRRIDDIASIAERTWKGLAQNRGWHKNLDAYIQHWSKQFVYGDDDDERNFQLPFLDIFLCNK